MKSYSTQIFQKIAMFFLVSSGLLTASSVDAQSGQILHNPSEVEISVGETFEVTVEVHTGEQPISVADFHMRFDPEYLEVLEINSIQGGLQANSIQPIFDNQNGTISMGSFQVGGQAPSGYFEAMQITFRGLHQTQTTSVDHPNNVFPKSILAYAGVDHLGQVGPLDITILPGVVSSNGIDLETEDLSLNLWPNPTAERTTITFQMGETGEASLEIFDVTGKLVSEIFRGTATSGTAHKFEVDVKHLKNGFYLCRLLTEKANKVERLVVGK